MSQTLDGDAVEAVAELARDAAGNHAPILIGDHLYTTDDNRLHRIDLDHPRARPLTLTSLTALMAYIDAGDFGGVAEDALLLHVESPTSVKLISALHLPEFDRHVFAHAQPLLPPSIADQAFDHEAFIVALQSRCQPSSDRDALITMASGIRDGSEVSYADDGTTQQVSGKAGITFMGQNPVKNPYHLVPYRTFHEVDQPGSMFIVRAKKEGERIVFRVFESDGGMWRLTAMDRIRAHLSTLSIPVLA